MTPALEARLRELLYNMDEDAFCNGDDDFLYFAREAARIALEMADATLTDLAERTRRKGLDRERYGVLDARDTLRALATPTPGEGGT